MNAEDTRIPRELGRQSEAKRKQAPQSDRQMCIDDENAISKNPSLLIAQDTQ